MRLATACIDKSLGKDLTKACSKAITFVIAFDILIAKVGLGKGVCKDRVARNLLGKGGLH